MMELTDYAKEHLVCAGCSIAILALAFVIVMCFVACAERSGE